MEDTGGGGLAWSFVKGISTGIRMLFFSVLLIFNEKMCCPFRSRARLDSGRSASPCFQLNGA